MTDAGSYRVVNGIGDNSADGHDWRLADAFGTEGAEGGGNLNQDGLDSGNVETARQGVVHEIGGQELAVLIIDHLLIERPAKALSDAAVNLAFDQRGIDGKADILDGRIV